MTIELDRDEDGMVLCAQVFVHQLPYGAIVVDTAWGAGARVLVKAERGVLHYADGQREPYEANDSRWVVLARA